MLDIMTGKGSRRVTFTSMVRVRVYFHQRVPRSWHAEDCSTTQQASATDECYDDGVRAYHCLYYVVNITSGNKIERDDDYAECDDSTSERLARSLAEGG